MDQFYKTFVTVLFVLTNVATAYYYLEDEPSLINENLRLAALGNLSLVLEEYGNEINIYNFGELSAGIIEDDSGKSSLYLRSIYGFDNTSEISSETDWTGGTIAIGGIYKYMKQWAIGGSFSGLKRDLGFYSPVEMSYVRYDIKNTRDTVVVAFQVFKWISLGLRGAYRRDMIKTTEYINYWESDDTTWLVDPSVSITLPGGKWFFGFGYTYTDMGYYSNVNNTKALTFPVVYRRNNLTVGIKVKHKLSYRSDGYMSDKETYGGIQSIYRIPIYNKTISIGALVTRDITCHYWEYGDPIHNWFMDFGVGVALINNDNGLLGVEIKHRIWQRYAPVYPKQTTLNFGLEFVPLKSLPVRIGYLYHWWNPEYPYTKQMIITMGSGIHLIDKKVRVDFAYNLRIGSFNWYTTLEPDIHHDIQNILGISARYTF